MTTGRVHVRGINRRRKQSLAEDGAVSNEYVAEALAKQAARRPPKAMPVTPTLPRVPKPYKRRRPKTGG